MKSGITLVPPSRWDHGCYYDPRPRVSDKTYCKVGAFLDFHASRNELGIPPRISGPCDRSHKEHHVAGDRAIRAPASWSRTSRSEMAVLISRTRGRRREPSPISSSGLRITTSSPPSKGRSPHAGAGSAIEQEVKAGAHGPPTTPHSWADSTCSGRLSSATGMDSWAKAIRLPLGLRDTRWSHFTAPCR